MQSKYYFFALHRQLRRHTLNRIASDKRFVAASDRFEEVCSRLTSDSVALCWKAISWQRIGCSSLGDLLASSEYLSLYPWGGSITLHPEIGQSIVQGWLWACCRGTNPCPQTFLPNMMSCCETSAWRETFIRNSRWEIQKWNRLSSIHGRFIMFTNTERYGDVVLCVLE
jgi:hypothetical protein